MIKLIFLIKVISKSKPRNHLIINVFSLNLSQCEKIKINIMNMSDVKIIEKELLLL